MLLRPEIEVLVDYLADRKLGIEVLADRKAHGRSGNLYANSNDDVDVWWKQRNVNTKTFPSSLTCLIVCSNGMTSTLTLGCLR